MHERVGDDVGIEIRMIVRDAASVAVTVAAARVVVVVAIIAIGLRINKPIDDDTPRHVVDIGLGLLLSSNGVSQDRCERS